MNKQLLTLAIFAGLVGQSAQAKYDYKALGQSFGKAAQIAQKQSLTIPAVAVTKAVEIAQAPVTTSDVVGMGSVELGGAIKAIVPSYKEFATEKIALGMNYISGKANDFAQYAAAKSTILKDGALATKDAVVQFCKDNMNVDALKQHGNNLVQLANENRIEAAVVVGATVLAATALYKIANRAKPAKNSKAIIQSEPVKEQKENLNQSWFWSRWTGN